MSRNPIRINSSRKCERGVSSGGPGEGAASSNYSGSVPCHSLFSEGSNFKSPKSGISLPTSDGSNLEDKDLVRKELTSSKDDETTLDHLANRLEDQSLNSNPIF
ncbi:hypothetical protein ACH5RR_034537 [Cinchona calisaya]|uniref:Uncharacterized protein n=1 Tax=Cinchona calisaya TaxID=153742 RepID=A0ABD2YB78_9GENT